MKEPPHEDEKAVANEGREAGTPGSSAAVGLSTAVMMGLAAVALLA